MTENTSAASDSTAKPVGAAPPELDQDTLERAREKVDELEEMYRPGARSSVVVPGTDGTIAGTAFSDTVGEQITENKPPEDLRKGRDT